MAKPKLRDARVVRIHEAIERTAADPVARTSRARKKTPASPVAETSRGIIVLGMHRAGTSVITNILVNLGFEIPGEPVPAKPDNPRGYWEPREIVEVHDEFFHLIGRSWSDPRPLDGSLFQGEGAAAVRERLRQVLRRLVAPRKRWIIKDPRMCRLMPLWDEALAAEKLDCRFVHILRSPLAVADSLEERDHFSREKSLLLWLRHNLEAEAATRGKDRSWLRFEEITTSPPPHVIRGFRSATGSPRLAKTRIQNAIEGILDPSLVHHEHGIDETLERLAAHPWVAKAYRALVSLCSDGDRAGQEALDEVRSAIHQADALLFGDAAHWEAERSGERFYWLKQSVDSQRREIETQRAEVDALRESFNAERERHERILQELARHHRSAESRHHRKLDALGESAGRVEQSLTALDAQHRKLDELGESVSGLAEQQVAAQEQRRKIAESLTAVEGQRHQLEALQESLGGQSQHFAALADSVAVIENLITDRLENRHLALLSKSLEVTAQIESEGISARAQLGEATRERDALRDELDRTLQEREVAIQEHGVAIQEHGVAIQEREVAIQEREVTVQACDAAAHERDVAVHERVLAVAERERMDARRQQALGELSAVQETLEQVRRQRENAEAEIAQLLQRASWKITAPLRAVLALFKGHR